MRELNKIRTIHLLTASLFVSLCSFSAVAEVKVPPPVSSGPLDAEQFRADFDQTIDYINHFAVHKDLNARRLGIDYAKSFATYRQQISDKTDICAFSRLLNKTLNLVQDLHASTMDYAYLVSYGKLQSRFNIDDNETYTTVGAIEQQCPAPTPTLDLPLWFIDNQYVVYADFELNGRKIKRGTTVTHINDHRIDQFVRQHIDSIWPVRMTATGKLYSTRFYRGVEGAFRLGFSDGSELSMTVKDAVTWSTPRTHNISYGSQSNAKVHLFTEQRLLYVGIPMMDESFVEEINSQMDRIVSDGGQFDKVAIDIRGNGGGSDMVWRRVLAHLVDRTLTIALDLRMKDNALTRRHYPHDEPAQAKAVSALGGAPYWLHNGNKVSFEPDTSSLRFKGPIYVLRDAYIYSSAANFADFASQDPQLVTIGDTTDLVGGAQIEPLFFKLKHSGLVFRLEPALDFSSVNKLDDFAHNHVEIKIQSSVEDLFKRSTYEGDVYGETFLLNHDPLIRHILSNQLKAQ